LQLDPPSLANYLHSFSETDKINFRGREDDNTFFLFPTFNSEDPDDPAVGLINGELAIKGSVLRREGEPIVLSTRLFSSEIGRTGSTRIELTLVALFFAQSSIQSSPRSSI